MRNHVQEIDGEHVNTAFLRAERQGGCASGHVIYLKLVKVFGVFVPGFLFEFSPPNCLSCFILYQVCRLLWGRNS